jgi:hypothetical protein
MCDVLVSCEGVAASYGKLAAAIFFHYEQEQGYEM